ISRKIVCEPPTLNEGLLPRTIGIRVPSTYASHDVHVVSFGTRIWPCLRASALACVQNGGIKKQRGPAKHSTICRWSTLCDMLTISLVALSLFAPSLAAIGPRADVKLVNANVAPDGFTRSAVTANGVIPGPLITANVGDQFNLNVINQLTDSTMLLSSSIHWHGFFQRNTSWADGPAFVSQCPTCEPVVSRSCLLRIPPPSPSPSIPPHGTNSAPLTMP
ncbi:Cupredoxin, partial [Mycena amicta]